jgi:ABC-2 type transport system ATP-binding protein
VGLAQALVHEPEVIVLDEPTAGLDPKQINESRALIRSLGGDHTIVLSTHILPEVALTCDRIVIIHRGRVVAQGTTEGLTAEIGDSEFLNLTVQGGEEEISRIASAADGVLGVEPIRRAGDGVSLRIRVGTGRDPRRELASRIVAAGLGLLELRKEGMTLEEVYLRVVTSEEQAPVEPAP